MTTIGGESVVIVPISGTVTWKSDEQFEQERLELVVRAVNLVNQEDGRGVEAVINRLQERAADEELGPEEVLQRLLAVAARRLDEADFQHLPRVVPLIQRVGDINALVALEADEARVQQVRENLGDLRLADARFAFEQDWLVQTQREEERRRKRAIRDVAVLLQDMLNAVN